MPTNAELHSEINRLNNKVQGLQQRVGQLNDNVAVLSGELDSTREQVAQDMTKIVVEVNNIKNTNPYRA